MKRIILCVSVAGALAAQAQTMTWQTPHVISGTSDVSTKGTNFASWAPYDGGANADPVNGVAFQGFSDLPDMGTSFPGGSGGGPYFNQPGIADANYDFLLQYGAYSGNATASFHWGGMTPGDAYEVQFWVEDVRGGFARWEYLSGGAVGAAVYGTDTSDAVGYNSPLGSGSTSPGFYIIGTFAADSAGSEEILMTGNASAQVNLFQVRAVPAATVLGLLTVSPSTNVDSGTAMTISGVATGNPPIYYQWQSNGVNILGATNSDITFTATDPSESVAVTNTYDLVVSNSVATNTSASVAITINPAAPAAAATNEAQPVPLFLGDSVTLSYAVTGTPPVWVEWEQNGSPIETFTNIGEATSVSMTLTGLQAGQGGAYTVIATNQFTVSPTNSQACNLIVNPYTQFTWFAPVPITTADAALELFGGATNPAVVFGAAGFANASQTVSLDDGQSITFEPYGTVASGNGTVYANGFSGIWSNTTGNANFDAVLSGIPNGIMANVSTLSFYNLTPGNLYAVQIFSVDERPANGAPDLVDFQDPADAANVSQAFLEGAGDYALGTFVADGTNQNIALQMPGLTGGGNVVNAAVVYSLPLAAEVWDTPTVYPSTNVYSGTVVTLSDALFTGLPSPSSGRPTASISPTPPMPY